MAAGTRLTNTMQEQLRKLLGSLADLKLAEDADLGFIGEIETTILGKLREPIDRMNAASEVANNMTAGGPPTDVPPSPMAGQATPPMPGGFPMPTPAAPPGGPQGAAMGGAMPGIGIPPEMLAALQAGPQQ